MYRCPTCRTRRMDHKLFTQHLRTTGHKFCTCGGYHYKHRSRSRCCVQNPKHPYWQAVRRGDSEEDLLTILVELCWENDRQKPQGTDCPF